MAYFELQLIELIFTQIGKAPVGFLDSIFGNEESHVDKTDDTVSMEEIKNWLKKNPQKFQSWYGLWQDGVERNISKLKLIDPESEKAYKNMWIITVLFMVICPWIILPGAIMNGYMKR